MQTEISGLIQILKESEKNYDLSKITAAYEFAAELHEGQFRVSGEPYISHPIAVAEIVAGLGLDTDSICAALLHDCIEQPYYVSWLHDDLTAATKAGEMDLAVYVVGKTEQ